MTKQQLQKELKDKVKPGVKPSHLKRSKSADDIPKAPPLPKDELKKPTDLNVLLQDQLKQKQKEVEDLRKDLETNPPKTSSELDQSLLARHKGLKDWFKQYSKNKELDTELQENIEQASEKLISQAEKINKLHTENNKLKQEKQSLSRDLELATKLAQSRKVPYYPTADYPDPYQQLKYVLYSLCAVGFTLWLVNNLKNIRTSPNNHD